MPLVLLALEDAILITVPTIWPCSAFNCLHLAASHICLPNDCMSCSPMSELPKNPTTFPNNWSTYGISFCRATDLPLPPAIDVLVFRLDHTVALADAVLCLDPNVSRFFVDLMEEADFLVAFFLLTLPRADSVAT